MNIVFIFGKIVSNIEFKFMINNKHISVVKFNVQLSNKSIIKVIAYDDMADKCYSELEKEDNISIIGNLLTQEILIKNIVKLY